MINTFLPHEMIPVITQNPANNRFKPKTVVEYNRTMGGLDEVDRKVKSYESQRKTNKWYRNVFFHHMDLSVYNSFRVYTILNPNTKISHRDFLLQIIQNIFDRHPPEPVTRGRKSRNENEAPRKVGNHYPKPIFQSNGNLKFSDCHFCNLHGKRAQTGYECDLCHKRLCIRNNPSCFQQYHSLPVLPKKKPRLDPESQYFDVQLTS